MSSAANVTGESSFEALDKALAYGKGVVVVCMHFGNWDLGAGAAAARGYPVTVVAETFADPRLDAMVAGSRTRLGTQIIKMEKTGPSLIRALKQNGLLALLIDRPVPGDGVRVTFFGEEVEGPRRTRPGSLCVPARWSCRPRSPASYPAVSRSRRSPTSPSAMSLRASEPHDMQSLTQAIMDVHERFIREYPDQWYMFREMWPAKRTSGR